VKAYTTEQEKTRQTEKEQTGEQRSENINRDTSAAFSKEKADDTR
jgi:hypothetical protein